MQISARNMIKGTVSEVKDGIVTAEVSVDIGGGNTIVSSITLASAKSLGLEPGKEVMVVVKASNVMLGVA